MNEKKYIAPVCESMNLASESIICDSGKANGDKYGTGSDFGGKDKWEGIKW